MTSKLEKYLRRMLIQTFETVQVYWTTDTDSNCMFEMEDAIELTILRQLKLVFVCHKFRC